ncbi:MAG: VOC family protein [Myxococcota bacterium]|nr:VOC family protein [Myxococcota bacterium]
MPYALDHVFLCCSVGAAAEAEALQRAGLTEGSPNVHPGQGTTCRRFFFRNAYIELLWISDVLDASSEATEPTRLLERWRGRAAHASPFGVALRPARDPAMPPPFESWAYRPQYLPPGLSIDMASAAPLEEPEMFYARWGRSPETREGTAREPMAHVLGVSVLSGVKISIGRHGLSPPARALAKLGLVDFASGPPLLELELDRGARGVELDFRPILPMILRA